MDVLAKLSEAFRDDRLGHAISFQMPSSFNNEQTVQSFRPFLADIMCLKDFSERQGPCGQCESCWIFDKQNFYELHPDLYVVRAESQTKGYTVEQIRDMIKAFHRQLNLSPYRIALISQADLLSFGGAQAGNALLKLLEEPQPRSLLFLTSGMSQNILSTLSSRCQHFRLNAEHLLGEGEEESSFEYTGWDDLSQWLQKSGCQKGEAISCPADREDFWKDRDRAMLELQALSRKLWTDLQPCWTSWDRQHSLYVYDFFQHYEQLLMRIKGYGQPFLHWLNFRYDARMLMGR